jgi:transposase-like protein
MKSPPFCPNPACPNHHSPRSKQWFWKAGRYTTAVAGTVQRFLCLHCFHRFSSQTFSIDYYAKRKVSYSHIDAQLRSTGSIRDIARDLSVSTATVLNRISRLAHAALAVHMALYQAAPQTEPFVADGFESYCVSQYFPNNITLLSGKASQYLYFANYCTLRRKGRMTERQKRIRTQLERCWRADPRASREAFDEVVEYIEEGGELFTDEKSVYRQSVRAAEKQITHVRISSTLPRTVRNDLFSVNYLEREWETNLAMIQVTMIALAALTRFFSKVIRRMQEAG